MTLKQLQWSLFSSLSYRFLKSIYPEGQVFTRSKTTTKTPEKYVKTVKVNGDAIVLVSLLLPLNGSHVLF